MITKFQQYESINEGWKNDFLSLAFSVTILFNQIGGDVSRRYDMEYLQKYFKSFNVATVNPLVQEAIKDFKMKILNDPKILNKQQVMDVIDSTPILFNKNDEICRLLYNRANKKSDGKHVVNSWCTTIIKNQDKKGAKSYIFLGPNAPYGDIIHELSHAIETVVDIDPKILNIFDFNKSVTEQKKLFLLMTDERLSNIFDIYKKSEEYMEYLKSPSEVYSRLNSLKFFLYKNKIINTPNDNIDDKIIYDIISGKIFKNLNKEERKVFMLSDFIEILTLINTKKNPDIDKFVNNVSKQKNIV